MSAIPRRQARRAHPTRALPRNGAPPDERIDRLAVLSVHTSPLDQPGTGDGGGLNVYVREVAERLAARGVRVDVFTRATAPDQPAVVEVTDGYRVHHVAVGERRPVDKRELPNLLCAFLLALERHVAERVPSRNGSAFDYDVVHAHYWLSGWVGRRLRERHGVPLVQSFHTLGRVKNAALAPGDEPEPPLRLIAEAQLVEDADRIIVPVCDEARLLHRAHGTSGGRLQVVQPGVDPTVFSPGRATEPAEAPPPRGGPLLLFVGRLQPLKGPDVAVRTLCHVRRALPSARLLVIGGESGSGLSRSGPEQLEGLARELGVADAVTFGPARSQEELAELYRAADVLLVPSRSESFGLVALEGQACGTPVVAADVGGLRAVVGAGGILVDGHDPSDHAAAVVGLLRDDERREATARAGRLEAATRTWNRTAAGLLEVYTSVTSAPRMRSTGA